MKPTRPPIVPRSLRPFDRLDEVIMQIITLHVGKPCPTTKEIREWTGMPMKRIWPYIAGMHARGRIEMEVQESKPCGRDPKRRRLRIAGGEWTLWTDRGINAAGWEKRRAHADTAKPA